MQNELATSPQAIVPLAIADSVLHCLHCNNVIPKDYASEQFCCGGCEFVYKLIHHEKLERFYHLKDQALVPVRHDWNANSYRDWIEQLPGRDEGRITVSLEGIQCTACIWLIRKLAERSGFHRCSIDSAKSSLTLQFDPLTIDLPEFFAHLQKFGYRTGPPRTKSLRHEMPLLLRLGVVSAIAMNSMTLSLCFYFGLDGREPGLFRFFNQLNLILAVAGVLFGGSYFFSRAWQSLKCRIVHFDTTISIGIIVGILASTYNLFFGDASFTYFDSLNGFIALMLLGRFIQTRTLEKHQKKIIAHTPLAEHLVLREVITEKSETSYEQIHFGRVVVGDVLLIPSRSIVPVRAQLVAPENLELQLNWISGESIPQLFHQQDLIPAGAQLVTSAPARIRAVESFMESRLYALDTPADLSEPLPKVWSAVTKWYVPVILMFGVLAFVLWARADIHKALQAAIAVTVVTCPCALGIAVPLARTLANRMMTEQGVFVRSTYFFERLKGLRKVVFDKTGTLTFANLTLKNPSIVTKIPRSELRILLAMVAGSNHPASQALLRELLPLGLTPAILNVHEEPGVGVHATAVSGDSHYVGRDQNFMGLAETQDYRVIWRRGDEVVARFEFSETAIDGLQSTIGWLQSRGIATYLCSGDRLARVERFAKEVGIPAGNVIGEANPEQKAAFVAALDDGDTLYLGDGINDILAIQKAAFRGTSYSVFSSGLAIASDLVFFAPHLRWLRRLIVVAEAFRKTLLINLWFVFAYNGLTLSLALAGKINPLMAAILMPASSLGIVALSLFVMRKADLNHGAA